MQWQSHQCEHFVGLKETTMFSLADLDKQNQGAKQSWDHAFMCSRVPCSKPPLCAAIIIDNKILALSLTAKSMNCSMEMSKKQVMLQNKIAEYPVPRLVW